MKKLLSSILCLMILSKPILGAGLRYQPLDGQQGLVVHGYDGSRRGSDDDTFNKSDPSKNHVTNLALIGCVLACIPVTAIGAVLYLTLHPDCPKEFEDFLGNLKIEGCEIVQGHNSTDSVEKTLLDTPQKNSCIKYNVDEMKFVRDDGLLCKLCICLRREGLPERFLTMYGHQPEPFNSRRLVELVKDSAMGTFNWIIGENQTEVPATWIQI